MQSRAKPRVSLSLYWRVFWMRLAGTSTLGRFATRLAGWGIPPYKGRAQLARLNRHGYIAPSAAIAHADLRCGRHVFIGERVVIYQNQAGGCVELGDHVSLHSDTIIEVGQGGSLAIGA